MKTTVDVEPAGYDRAVSTPSFILHSYLLLLRQDVLLAKWAHVLVEHPLHHAIVVEDVARLDHARRSGLQLQDAWICLIEL